MTTLYIICETFIVEKICNNHQYVLCICKYFLIAYLKSSDSFSVTLEMGNARSCMEGSGFKKAALFWNLPLIK